MQKYIRLRLNTTSAYSRASELLLLAKRPVGCSQKTSQRFKDRRCPIAARLATGGGIGDVGCGIYSLVPTVARAFIAGAVHCVDKRCQAGSRNGFIMQDKVPPEKNPLDCLVR